MLLLLATASCATHTLSRPVWTKAANESGLTLTNKTVWTFFWGLSQQNINPTNCLGPGLAEVTVKGNVGYSLIALLSLGSAMPVNIEWRCAAPKQ